MILQFKSLFFLVLTISCLSPVDARSYARKRPKKNIPKIELPELAIKTNGINFLQKQRDTDSSVLSKLLPVASFEDQKKQPFMVRVLLAQADAQQNLSWCLTSEDDFFVAGDSDQLRCCKKGELSVSSRNAAVYLNGKRWSAQQCSVIPRSGHIDFEGRTYAGIFCIEMHNNNICIINQVPLEEYVASVLNCESWPGWPVEVNKAFAIASRSYLVCKILESRKQKKPYHIKNTNIHQTYKGVHTSDRLKQAIEQTRGLILTHNKKPIEAMFDSCCGGIIPAHIANVNFKKAPYLARTYPCTYCKSCKIYAWSVEYSPELMETVLQKAGHSIKQIKEVKIHKKDSAGAVQSVLIKGAHKSLQLSGKQMYSTFSKLKSFCYSVEKRGKSIVFKGRGYGHHLGLCQWGARRMIDAGMNYASILQFYYPGTHLMELHAKL